MRRRVHLLRAAIATRVYRSGVAGARRPRCISARRMVCVSLAFLLVLCCPFSPDPVAQDEALPVYDVKVAFIYQFTKFISWPEASYESKKSPFVICVVGDDGIVESLRSTVSGKRIDGRAYEVRHVKRTEASPKCHVLFQAAPKDDSDTPCVDRHGGPGVLTICDCKGFAHRGGIMRLFEEGNVLKMEINVDAAKRAELMISSKLLSLVTVVHDEKKLGPSIVNRSVETRLTTSEQKPAE